MVSAIVGANWGDEGKGKITDVVAENFDIVIRFQGGSNAGHTIINKYGKFILHQMPSGVFYPHIINIIGNGVALNVECFMKEINELKKNGVPCSNILISNRAQIVMPYHILFDNLEEERLSSESFGSTRSGIAPLYSDKCLKIGFQVNELFDDSKNIKAKIKNILKIKNIFLRNFYSRSQLLENVVYEKLVEYKNLIKPYVCDTFNFLYQCLAQDKKILLEGQLGALKDLDFGIYPMVTSSNTISSYGAVGTGIPAREIKRVITVVKAYSSSIGAGEFVSEIFGEEAEKLRAYGGDTGEYGATTGRPRRMGWLDLVATRYGCRIQGTTSIAFTALDVLGYLDEIPVCVGYKINEIETQNFPETFKLKKATPIFKKFSGWKSDIRGVKNYSELPDNCKRYIEFVENSLGFPIKIISIGPKRDEIIYR